MAARRQLRTLQRAQRLARQMRGEVEAEVGAKAAATMGVEVETEEAAAAAVEAASSFSPAALASGRLSQRPAVPLLATCLPARASSSS